MACHAELSIHVLRAAHAKPGHFTPKSALHRVAAHWDSPQALLCMSSLLHQLAGPPGTARNRPGRPLQPQSQWADSWPPPLTPSLSCSRDRTAATITANLQFCQPVLGRLVASAQSDKLSMMDLLAICNSVTLRMMMVMVTLSLTMNHGGQITSPVALQGCRAVP